MKDLNGTEHAVKEFYLVGVPGLQDRQNLLCILFLLLYVAVMAGNLLMLYLVLLDQRLHTPMYFFLCHLSVLDVLLSTLILPKMMAVFLLEDRLISFAGCFLQMYLILASGSTENIILLVMAYDRYVAIMKPLHYHLIINGKVCVVLTTVAWALGYMAPLLHVLDAMSLPYCGPNIVQYCYCDFSSVAILACADVTDVLKKAVVAAMCVVNIPLLLILGSYFIIILNIYSRSKEDSKKAFSTCASHLFIVSVYYFSADLLYITVVTGSMSADNRVIMGVLSYLLTPLLNPIVYSLRNKQIKQAAKKYLTFSCGSKCFCVN
ncbi:olfactory receptor 10A4-like [Erpetoichthys calabaricus]|uniref:olfactory receptor 10A4-like n=1 Tax=Erpetoichthys calabaricus TaxID=27687 RepID=UPI0010A05886|nr:olfactory receptor 10A4-like [Erpetoichthys calabaricus]